MDLRIDSTSIDDGTRRELHLSGIDGHNDLRITFDLVGERELPLPQVWDGFINGALLFAMQTGQPLRVHGALSRQYLIHQSLFQEAWASMLPERYQQVEVMPSDVLDAVPPGPPRAISAYTGGIDSLYSLHRHTRGSHSLGRIPLEAVLFVQFAKKADKGIPENLFRKSRPMLESCGVELRTMRTNIRGVTGQNWIDAFGAFLSACLYNYAPHFGMAVLASNEPVRAMVMPVGSNPATDWMLSSPAMSLIHDGVGASRTEKVATIGSDPHVRRALQVCHKRTDENCGVCRKCIRTRLNFLAAGLEAPESFGGPLDPAQIGGVEIKIEADCNELQGILDYAECHGVRDDWTRRLQARIDRYRPLGRREPRLRRWQKSVRRSFANALR